ncbi:MAG: DUF2207 domain-containing protein [bacterium]
MKTYKNIIKILSLVGVFSFLLFSATSVFAEEKINNFDAQIIVNSDASILVTETIKYDFGGMERHGIYRDIPVKYNTNFGNKSIKLEVQNVKRDGNNEKYTTSFNGSNESIKIGDANFTINGEHTYVILYKVKGAIGYFDNYDELYWNITGNDWTVSIENTSASIELPQNAKVIQSSCYLGILGSQEKCDINTEENKITVNSVRALNSREGMTLALGFPKGVVYQPTKLENTVSNIKDNVILLLPIIIFIILFLIWWKKGRDPKGLSTIIAEYEPPENMKPTLIGSLVDGKVDPRDITAGLVYLAEQGFVKITKLEKQWILGNTDYELELLKNDASGLEMAEKSILGLFFSNSPLTVPVYSSDLPSVGTTKRISDFRTDVSFKLRMGGATSDISQDMVTRGFYEKDPNKAKTPYVVLIFIIFPFMCFFTTFFSLIYFLCFGISGLIIIIFGMMMGKKTKLGAETKDHILGFKEFLSVTEKDRLDFHNAPEKNPEQFMQFLPYAIALGVEKKWAKQFEGIYIPEPNWYHGNVVGSFVAMDFASHMSGFSESFGNSAMSGGSGSGGGGFSGGGGGGGGGGSW